MVAADLNPPVSPRQCRLAWPHLPGLALLFLLTTPPGYALDATDALQTAGRSALIDAASPCSTDRKGWYSLHCTLMETPLQILPSVEVLESELLLRIQAPSELSAFATRLRLGKASLEDSSPRQSLPDHPPEPSADLLERGLRLLLADSVADTADLMDRHLPKHLLLKENAQAELGRLLLTLAQAEAFRQQAFAKLPPSIHAQRWIEGLGSRDSSVFESLDLVAFLPETDAGALAAGMQALVAAVERFRAFALTHREWPALSWEIETKQGSIIIDLSDTDTDRTISRPLLLIDRAGNDRYRFVESAIYPPISVLIDMAGDDEYHASAPATCPSSAIMGYGILWDESGNDRYEGARLSQSAAVMGSSLLFDGSGEDSFLADLQSQAFAIFGAALLINGGQDTDRYHALSQAQGAAGPAGMALLIDGGGNDHYILANDRVVVPSAQLPDRNASLGQGSAFGIRSNSANSGLLGGGVGILFDLSGDDIYRAQVFAQGSGYFHGTGILLDGAGQDDYETAWYGMGAAAHGAIGVLIDRGNADDRYAASHSTSLSAAHDRSLTLFLDAAGNDSYELGGLGLGAAHEESVALFFELAGTDRYRVQESSCRAFGVSLPLPVGATQANSVFQGIFIDADGDDQFPMHCVVTTRDRPRFD